MTLNELRQLRHEWVESNRKNGFEDGIKRLLTDLYPENAHFIYELLQNAEDTGASVARFTLGQAGLEFEHDGDRLFSLKDVESITSIGNSTKRDDPTTVGKFGVGFKAVFAYTNTPEVHSGAFHFRIRDLVVPEVEGVAYTQLGARATRFLFPFDNVRKSPVQAVAEIGRGLLALGDNTLLFLRHIRTIEYLLPDGSLGALKRVDHPDGRIEIQALHPGKQEVSSNWLRLEKDVEVTADDNDLKPCRIAIAFSLVEAEGKKGGISWRIVPLERGEVSIYFPAEKETSNLRFHLHAPFASTVARDSVRDCEANHQLRDHLAQLLVESIPIIRDRGLLTVSFLSTLPNPADNLSGNSPFYEPIRLAVVDAFQDESLTPTRSGSHAKAASLFRGPSRVAEALPDDDLSKLTGYAVPLWAANPPPQSPREDSFLESLEIDTWDWSDLSICLSELDEDQAAEIDEWLALKEDAWLMRFYASLGEAGDVHGFPVDCGHVRIARVMSHDGHTSYTHPSHAFFPSSDDAPVPSDILLIKPEVYSAGRSDSQRKYARSFLETAGVRPFDAQTRIELLLTPYQLIANQLPLTDTHFHEIAQFVSFWKSNPGKVDLFKRRSIILDKDRKWRIPGHLYLDSPLLDTGLAQVADVLVKFGISPEYTERLDQLTLQDFSKFLIAIGVQACLAVEKISVWGNPDKALLKHISGRATYTGINEDYQIPALEKYLAKKTVAASKLVWHALIAADSKVAVARFRPNQEYPLAAVASRLVHVLKQQAWVPDKAGKFFKPDDICRDDLPEEFRYDDRNGLLTAIGLGENAKRRSAEYQAREQKRLDLGFESDDALLRAQEFAKLPATEQQRILEEHARHNEAAEVFPHRPVRNAEFRRKRVRDQASETPAKTTQVRSRMVPVGYGIAKEEARLYLREQYTNENSVMFCQACRASLPFRLPSGEHYFEAVDVFVNGSKRFRESFLAMCPNHSAMFEYANAARETFFELIAEATEPMIEIVLAGNQVTIEFTEEHLIDIQACLDSLPDDIASCNK